MNYKKIYKHLVQKRLKNPSTQNYTQTHHIVPRSINPQLAKCKFNLIILSAREHFIAHALLVKITQKSKDKTKYYKMVYAFQNMNRNSCNSRYTNSHLYQLMKYRYSDIRKQLIKQFSPTKNKMWISNIELNQIKLLNNNQQIPQGWVRGKINKEYLNNYYDALNEQNHHHFINYQQDINNRLLPRILPNRGKIRRKDIRQERTQLAKKYFEEYKKTGYKGVVQKFNYQYTDEALCQFFNRYLGQQYINLKKSRNKCLKLNKQ